MGRREVGGEKDRYYIGLKSEQDTCSDYRVRLTPVRFRINCFRKCSVDGFLLNHSKDGKLSTSVSEVLRNDFKHLSQNRRVTFDLSPWKFQW